MIGPVDAFYFIISLARFFFPCEYIISMDGGMSLELVHLGAKVEKGS